jgi:hypothetical protein
MDAPGLRAALRERRWFVKWVHLDAGFSARMPAQAAADVSQAVQGVP